jgi:hypothetical protein
MREKSGQILNPPDNRREVNKREKPEPRTINLFSPLGGVEIRELPDFFSPNVLMFERIFFK